MEHADGTWLCELPAHFKPAHLEPEEGLDNSLCRKGFPFADCSSEQLQCEGTWNSWLHALLASFAGAGGQVLWLG